MAGKLFPWAPDHREPVRRGKKRRYDSMLNDIYECFDQIDWGQALIRMGETMIQLGLEGQMGHHIDAATGAMFPGQKNFGLQSQVQHVGALDPEKLDSPYGGAWHAVRDPFEIISDFKGRFNEWAGVNQYNRDWSIRGIRGD